MQQGAKKLRKRRQARGCSVIPAQEHRRYCSKSCRRGAVQEQSRRSVESLAISVSKRMKKRSWVCTNKIKQIVQQNNKIVKN